MGHGVGGQEAHLKKTWSWSGSVRPDPNWHKHHTLETLSRWNIRLLFWISSSNECSESNEKKEIPPTMALTDCLLRFKRIPLASNSFSMELRFWRSRSRIRDDGLHTNNDFGRPHSGCRPASYTQSRPRRSLCLCYCCMMSWFTF